MQNLGAETLTRQPYNFAAMAGNNQNTTHPKVQQPSHEAAPCLIVLEQNLLFTPHEFLDWKTSVLSSMCLEVFHSTALITHTSSALSQVYTYYEGALLGDLSSLIFREDKKKEKQSISESKWYGKQISTGSPQGQLSC